MKDQELEKWEKHAKDTYEQLMKSTPTKENAVLLASAITIMYYDKFKELENKLTRSDRYDNRDYDSYENRRYESRYMRDRY